jgi:hypothetical protein
MIPRSPNFDVSCAIRGCPKQQSSSQNLQGENSPVRSDFPKKIRASPDFFQIFSPQGATGWGEHGIEPLPVDRRACRNRKLIKKVQAKIDWIQYGNQLAFHTRPRVETRKSFHGNQLGFHNCVHMQQRRKYVSICNRGARTIEEKMHWT